MSSHWSQFWQSTKTLNSFSASENALGYRGELLAFWQQQFAYLTPKAHVVDLGTGNGALALAAQRYNQQQQLDAKVIGVDAAAIDPCAVFADEPSIINDLKHIQFYAECSIEALPFKASSINLLVSQFALEYAPRDAAVKACAMVLAPAGHLVAVMHHKDAEIAYDCAAGLKVITAFLFGSRFQQDALNLLNKVGSAVSLQAANQQLLHSVAFVRQQLNSELEQEWFAFIMQRFAPLFMNIDQVNDNNNARIVRFTALIAQLTATYQRLTDQHQAALDQEGIALWAEAFRQQQLTVDYAELNIESQLFGWVLTVKA